MPQPLTADTPKVTTAKITSRGLKIHTNDIQLESQIISLLAIGKNQKQIAEKLHVDTHIVNDVSKLRRAKIVELRTRLENTTDEALIQNCKDIALSSQKIIQSNLDKYIAQDKELKPSDLASISFVQNHALEKSKTLQIKETEEKTNTKPNNIFIIKEVNIGDKQSIKPAVQEVIAETITEIAS